MAAWWNGVDLRRRRHGGAWDGMDEEERRGISEGWKGEVVGFIYSGLGAAARSLARGTWRNGMCMLVWVRAYLYWEPSRWVG